MRARNYARLIAAVARVELNRKLGRPCVPYKLEFVTTFACESRCRTCNIWQRYIDEPERRARELEPDDFARTAYSARDHVRWISLTGGEILERPDLPDIVQGIVDAVGDRLAMLNFTTNGMYPDRTREVFPELARLTRGIPVYISVSLDGIGRNYERLRGVPDGFRRVKKSMAALRELSRIEPHLSPGYQVTLSQGNLHEADALFDEAQRGSGSRPIFTLATNALQLTRGKLDVDLRSLGREAVETVERVWRRYPSFRPTDLPPWIHLGLSKTYFERGHSPLPCVGGQASLTIDPYGRVLQCDSRSQELATLQDHDFDLVALCHSKRFQKRLAPDLACTECWTPCLAYPTVMHHPVSSLLSAVKERVT